MANIKVSEMTEATSFDDGDYTMIVQANQNKKISKENMLSDIPTIQNNISTINANIGNLSNLETTDISNLVNSINSLTPKILWENPDPSGSFATQNITLNNNDYDCYEVIYYGNSTTGANVFNTGKIPKGKNFFLQQVYNTGGGAMVRSRQIDYINDTTLNVRKGLENGQENNVMNVPMYIIGYKTGLFNNEGEENEI